MGSDESHFNVSLIVRTNYKTVSTACLKKKESRSKIEPQPFCYALPLGQTGSLSLSLSLSGSLSPKLVKAGAPFVNGVTTRL